MQKNELIRVNNRDFRILHVEDERCLVIDCQKKTMPYWMKKEEMESAEPPQSPQYCPECRELNPKEIKVARERFTMIADILPVVANVAMRAEAINRAVSDYGVSQQTVRKYLCEYLVNQDISCLAPKSVQKKELTKDEKNMRWALNKFFYTTHKNTLKTAYTMMLKYKYCDDSGNLFEHYPSFYQFRYFYRTNKDMRNYYISREGIKSYQRNHRPLLGEGVQAFTGNIGTYMLDATTCDIYLVDEGGNLVGRPILTAAVDAYSGLCVGYYLSWEGGVYSLQNLMLNIVSDKVELCRKHGVLIDKADWPVTQIGGRLMTDMGKEYTSELFSQISELGVTITNIQAYRPDLKSVIERFFETVQNKYKPYLKRKGVVEPDFRERGATDYRKDACLTMDDFQKIVLRAIIFYNSQRVHENFDYSIEMIESGVEPHSSSIWLWSLSQGNCNLLSTTEEEVVMALLPRTVGNFGKNGLVVNKMRYGHPNYIQQYLTKKKNVTVAFNPDDVTYVWLIEEDGTFVRFELIESRYREASLNDVNNERKRQQEYIGAFKKGGIQAEIDLANHIQTIAQNASAGPISASNVKITREKEQRRSHEDLVRKVVDK